jgi:hypothetical protein
MRLKPIRINKTDYRALLKLEIKPRPGWWAVFSVNGNEQVWPFVCFGVTDEADRVHVPLEEHPLLREIAGIFLNNVNPTGGRFFINEIGAFFIKGEKEVERSKTRPEQFIVWLLDEPLPERPIPPLPESLVKSNSMTFRERLKMTQR